MKNLTIEGFKITTNLDEQSTFRHHCAMDQINPDTDECIESIVSELIAGGNITDFIECVGIDEMPVTNYFHTNKRGYNDRRNEPFNWRASKKKLTLIYTGAMGGGEWFAEIFL